MPGAVQDVSVTVHVFGWCARWCRLEGLHSNLSYAGDFLQLYNETQASCRIFNSINIFVGFLKTIHICTVDNSTQSHITNCLYRV